MRKNLIGVVGMDVLVQQFLDYGNRIEDIVEGLRREEMCYKFDISP